MKKMVHEKCQMTLLAVLVLTTTLPILKLASEIIMPQHSPLGVEIVMEGRYLFVAMGCPGHTALTLCEIQVWVI